MTFKRLGLLGAHAARAVGRKIDLTSARLDFVTVLMQHGSLCQRDIAAKLCVSQAVISRMVRGLMEQGFVKREIPLADLRFRMVSLTAFGRQQYLSLTDELDCLLPGTAHFDAQALGEGIWRSDWNTPLERMGLAFLAQIERGDWTPHVPQEPLFTAMRMHLRDKPYRQLGVTTARITNTWLFHLKVLEPPVHLGLCDDPLSNEYAANWLPPPAWEPPLDWQSPRQRDLPPPGWRSDAPR